MDWLQKLLAGLTGGNPLPTTGGTPPFLPKQDVPLHTSVPDPDRPPFIQRQGHYGEAGTPPVQPPYNEVPGMIPSTVTGNTAVDPLQAALATARGDYQKAVSEPAKKQNPWMQALFQGLQLTQRIADPRNPANAQPVQWLGEAKKSDRVRKAAGTLAPLEEQQNRILTERQKQAQTENIYADNARMEMERQDRKAKASADLTERKRTNFYRQNKNFDPTKATPAQRKQLEEIGETPESIGKYDFSKPTFKTVGDTTYKWDANENAFVDSGLAKDPTKKATEITVKDPETKQVYTFVTSQEKAAQLMNSRTVAGLQIEAAKDRQLNQQQFTGRLESAKMQHRMAMKQYEVANGRVKTLDNEKAKFIAAYTKENGSPPSDADVQQYLNVVTSMLDEPE